MKTFSIITPVYNGQEYIANCINAIANANYDLTKIEHIVVDDGSTDNTKKICEELSKKYPHVKFYSKTNGNWGSVINYVKHNKLVHNDYVIVCDADDLIIPDAFKYVNNKNDDADIFCGAFKIQNSKGIKLKMFPYIFLAKRNFVKTEKKFYISRYLVPNCVYFKKNVFYNIGDLKEKIMYQDVILFAELYKHSHKVRFTKKALSIYWRGRPNNTMSQIASPKAIASLESNIKYYSDNDLIEPFSLQVMFLTPVRHIVKKKKEKVIFHHKPKFSSYPWYVRVFVWMLYIIIAKKYIKIV